MNFYNLRKNQNVAINKSIENNFKSGVHFHATGTGKSVIALELILKYNEINKGNILWLCEQKFILTEQFNRNKLKQKGYDNIFNTFLILNFTNNKPDNWFSLVNSALFWKKPILLIINRSFLVSKKKYEKLKINFGLIIHDECHSIKNKTTQEFYKHILRESNTSCLGFSATPHLQIEPYNTIISKYTIYDAFLDNVIVPPVIKWISSESVLNDIDYLHICKKEIKHLYYKKIIVWCGIIEKCYNLYNLWERYFTDFSIYIDTSKEEENEDFKKFSKEQSNSILFCASKHREGSDIKNLDCCIFLDKVKNRNSHTFIQCIGRVLRKDVNNNKKSGLIIDLKASSCIKVCDRVSSYLNCDGFPWDYSFTQQEYNSKKYIKHKLALKKPVKKQLKQYNYTIQDVQYKFIRTCKNDIKYHDRLSYELKLIQSKNLQNYLMRAVEILQLTEYIPHVTRGSCGSSLVCYLLGISNVDPVEQNISFSRFLNDYRDNLPDIDFDFPHYLRDEVFLKLELKWPNQVARISNHVHWHEKSALREAIRKIGITKQIPKENLNLFVRSLSQEKKKQVLNYKKKLENTFRHYSLHCGGIVFFNDGIPDKLKLNSKTISQITYDKNEVSKTKNFKIDILSSRGISQLITINKNIVFDCCEYDEKTYNLLKSGDNIGITLAESPLMKKALLKIKPSSLKDIAICLAIIRPAAKDANVVNNEIDYNTNIIFDDDAIQLLSDYLNISEDLADKFRRCLSKNKWTKKYMVMYSKLFNKLDDKKKTLLKKQIDNLRFYGFCKAHSFSYAQLVYKLAYHKAHYPKEFWESTLKNVCSSYRKWVHIYNAFKNGVDVNKVLQFKNDSFYSKNKKNITNLLPLQQMRIHGYWDMKKHDFLPGCYFYRKNEEYYFNGIIASVKYIPKCNIIICYLGVMSNKYIEVVVKNKFFKSSFIGLKGRAYIKNEIEQSYESFISIFY